MVLYNFMREMSTIDCGGTITMSPTEITAEKQPLTLHIQLL